MITNCKKCGSRNLYLEPRVQGQDILTADMVALKCKDCGAWLKWCPKNERANYLKTQGQNRTKQDETGQNDKWQKLKEWLEQDIKNKSNIDYEFIQYQMEGERLVLEKMQELEAEDVKD